MGSTNFAFPTWIERLPARQQGRARIKFVLKFAAVMATSEGSITALSKRIGLHRNSLNSMIAQGQIDNGLPVNVIKAIESAIGVGVIPRAVMNPGTYDTQ
jgi:DNA-binding transcriptional regulator YdaS (Cro superfamily)